MRQQGLQHPTHNAFSKRQLFLGEWLSAIYGPQGILRDNKCRIQYCLVKRAGSESVREHSLKKSKRVVVHHQLTIFSRLCAIYENLIVSSMCAF